MNIGKFASQHDRFDLLGLTAQFDFKTQTSISFLVGEGPSHFFAVLGKIEVHHPCVAEFEDAAKVRMRISLPTQYLTEEKMAEAIKALYSALEIPNEDLHQIRFFEVGPKAFVVQNYEVVAYTPVL